MDVVLVSHNAHKIKELQAMLCTVRSDVRVLSLDAIGFSDEILETGETFEENAQLKARAVTALGYIGIADDSGLEVDALNGAPGVYSARYAGEPCNDLKNNLKLLNRMWGIEDHTARFVSAIAVAFPKGMSHTDFTVRGVCEGVLLDEFQGDGGFGYDPLFFVPALAKTFAEMTAEEKNTISHRAKAMAAFLDRFTKEVLHTADGRKSI